MFDDQTIDVTCPLCGHKNPLLVREMEAKTESHIVCEHCNVGVRIETRGFQERLNQIRKELEEIEREADIENRRQRFRRTKYDYQI